MADQIKFFANPSNARRAARKAGYELDQIELVQEGALTGFRLIEKRPEEAPTDPEAPIVVASTDGGDYGLIPGMVNARAHAQEIANAEGIQISLRDPTSDAVFEVISPVTEKPVPEFENDDIQPVVGEVMPPVVQTDGFVAGDEIAEDRDIMQSVTEGMDNPPVEEAPTPVAVDSVADILRRLNAAASGENPSEPAMRALCSDAAVVIQDLSRGRKAPKVTRVEGGSGKRAAKEAPEGKTAEIIALCCREEGASPAELIAATGWTKAPWKYLLSNPKGTGLAQRYGYDLAVSKEGRSARYLLVKQETAPGQGEYTDAAAAD